MCTYIYIETRLKQSTYLENKIKPQPTHKRTTVPHSPHSEQVIQPHSQPLSYPNPNAVKKIAFTFFFTRNISQIGLTNACTPPKKRKKFIRPTDPNIYIYTPNLEEGESSKKNTRAASFPEVFQVAKIRNGSLKTSNVSSDTPPTNHLLRKLFFLKSVPSISLGWDMGGLDVGVMVVRKGWVGGGGFRAVEWLWRCCYSIA